MLSMGLPRLRVLKFEQWGRMKDSRSRLSSKVWTTDVKRGLSASPPCQN